MLVARVIEPGSKLAFARGLQTETATTSPGEVLEVSRCDEDDLCAAMDWLLKRLDCIGKALPERHLADGTLVLFYVSSAALEGRTCPLGEIGHAPDGVNGRLQAVHRLLATTAWVPIAIEVFDRDKADPKTLTARITKREDRFKLARICLVGDRGMLTSARITDELRPAQLDWITALRAPQSRPWSRPTRCNCRCSMSRTSSRSHPRIFPASGWCAAATGNRRSGQQRRATDIKALDKPGNSRWR